MWIIATILSQQTYLPTSVFAQLGIASIVCALLLAALWILWREGKAKDATALEQYKAIEALQALRVMERDTQFQREREAAERYRELVERIAPMLSQSANLMAQVPAQFERALTDAQLSPSQIQMEITLRRLEVMAKQLDQPHD